MEAYRHEPRGDGDIMDVMEVPRTRHTDPPKQRTPEPPRSVPPPTVEEADDPRLWEFLQKLDLSEEHFRAEFIEGTIVVSGIPCWWHEDAVMWLVEHLLATSRARGWKVAASGGLEGLPEPARLIRPDLLICDLDSARNDTADTPLSTVQLVAEVVSKGSKRADRELKPLSCARAGIPVYLCVDRFVSPATVTAFSEPGPDGYQRQETVQAGPGGGKLTVPEPFDVVLDLASLPMLG
jgi:Uma2 family endonuclease